MRIAPGEPCFAGPGEAARDRVPEFAAPGDRAALCSLLEAAGYNETRLRELLGGEAGAPRAPDPAMLRRRTATHPDAGVLVRLLAAGDAVSREEFLASFGAVGLALFERTGLIDTAPASGPQLCATVRLVPAGPHLVASDRPDRHRRGAADFVTGPAPVSRHLASLVIPRPVNSALDLGCGSGVLALGLADHAGRVLATDLNPRAVAMTRFNAALNGVDRIEARPGDLFETLRGERFDRIVCNPPFVISPRASFIYRDGGAALSRRIVREAPDHLAAGGCLQMLCNWPERAGQDWRAELAEWFAGIACDAWVLREHSFDALTYAGLWLGQQYPEGIPDAILAEWLAYLADQGIDAVGGGLVVLRQVSGRAPWQELRELPALQAPAGESIARTCEARDRVLRLASDDALLAARWRPAPQLECRVTRRAGADGWQLAESRLSLAAGLQFAAQADPVATGILGRLDGRRSLREAAAAFADEHELSLGHFLPTLPAAFRALAWLGLALPIDG